MPRRREFDEAILVKVTSYQVGWMDRAAIELGITRSEYIRRLAHLDLAKRYGPEYVIEHPPEAAEKRETDPPPVPTPPPAPSDEECP